MTFKIPESVLIIIFQSNGQCLLFKRTDNGLWQSVTGARKPGEAIEGTASRELQEESGLTPAQGFLTNTGRVHRYPIIEPWRPRYAPHVKENTEFVFHFALHDFASIEIQLNPREHSEFQWVPAKRAREMVFSETNRKEIEALFTV